jgi:hypothetical protein
MNITQGNFGAKNISICTMSAKCNGPGTGVVFLGDFFKFANRPESKTASGGRLSSLTVSAYN